MKPISTFVIAASVILVACSKTSVMEEAENTASHQSQTARMKPPQAVMDIHFTEENLFPEGVVYDKFNNRFYVSSTTRGDIGIVGTDGSYQPFITDPALTGTTGLQIDEARKLLWVANSADGSVGIYDITTGSRVAFVDLKLLLPGALVFINDIALDPQGNAYITNSRTPVIYKVSRDGTASIFYQDEAFTTTGFGFNGIEYGNSGGGYLLVAHSAFNEVIRFPISAPGDYSVVDLNASLTGPDGLLLSKNEKNLVVVNNAGGGNGKVITFTSKNKWQSGMAVSSFETGSVFPTTATTDGKSVYVLYAYLHLRSAGRTDYTIKRIPGTEKL